MEQAMNKVGLRAKTRDVAFKYRMGAGFAGDVNRTHPAAIEAALIDASQPPLYFGEIVMLSAANAGVRPVIATDAASATSTVIAPFGVSVRPFPSQQASTSADYGGITVGLPSAPPKTGVIDVLRSGLITMQLNSGAGTPAKGDRVWVWCGASAAGHTQGLLETASSGTDTVLLPSNYTFNGPPDADGITEVSVNV